MQIEETPVESVKPYAGNPRRNETAVAKVAASIREFGFRQPIVVDEKMVVIAGHTRLAAAKVLGLTTVPVHIAHGLSPEKVRAYRLADNRTNEEAEWDFDKLRAELEGLKLDGVDLSSTGFDEDEIARALAEGGEGLTDPDEVPEAPARAVTVQGDTWILGKHRLRCGDSTVADDVDSLLGDDRASLVFTDPPYGVEYQSNMRTKTQRFDVLENDDQFLDIAPIIEMFSSGWVFVWTSWKVQNKWVEMFSGFGYPTNIVIWHKPGGGIGDLKRTFSSDYEVALVWHRGAELCGKRIGSVWTVNKDAASTYVHPTQKPVALAVEAIDKTTRSGAVVLDLFSGSGSTLIACQKTGREGRVMELDPKFCDVAIKRWQDFTGQAAVLESSGQPFAEVAESRYDFRKDGFESYELWCASKRGALQAAE